MLSELRELLTSQGITSAAIIDDAYDEIPTSREVDEESWNFFLDDMLDDDIKIIKEDYEITDPDSRWDELRNDDRFIKFLWDRENASARFKALFEPFKRTQAAGQEQLRPLRSLLFEDLSLQGGVFDSSQIGDAATAQLLFVDLFLGSQQDPDARNKALTRVKDIVNPRREAPPMILLMSSSPLLQSMRDEFRDEAGLVGCQFGTISKADLLDPDELFDLIYRLGASYQKNLRLSGFLELLQQALGDAAIRFMKTVRRLDLRDYADLQNLVLNAEGELMGAYLLEVFGKYFQFELEEDTRLSAEAVKINEMNWDSYAPPHFLPATETSKLTDGLLFRSPRIFADSDPLQFGDVLFSQRIDALGEGESPIANFAEGERVALLVLTPACDLQHCYANRYLFVAGVAKQSQLSLHKNAKPLHTPMLIHDGQHFVIDWDSGNPITWSALDLEKQLSNGNFKRVRRFRSIFSLQLQQQFMSKLSRIGTPVMPPVQQLVGVTISFRSAVDGVDELLTLNPSDQKAVILIGRDATELVYRLVLEPECVRELRREMRRVDLSSIRENQRSSWERAINSPIMFSMMKEGLEFSGKKTIRPFAGTEYDIMSVVGPYVPTSPIDAVRRVTGNLGPLIVELKLPENA